MGIFGNLFGSEAKPIEVYTAPPVVVNNRSDFGLTIKEHNGY